MTISPDMLNTVRIAVFIVSLIINSVALLYWLRRKLRLNEFIVGKWEGTLDGDKSETSSLWCELIVCERNDRDSAAYLIYESRCLTTKKLFFVGVDKHKKHHYFPALTLSRKWSSQFERYIQWTDPDLKVPELTEGQPLPKYEWKSTLKSIFWRPKLDVEMAGNGVTYKGELSKC